MAKIVLAVLLLLPACAQLGSRSAEERMLIACEAWAQTFQRINLRDKYSLATDEEIAAIDAAIPIMNPVCVGTRPDDGFDILTLEAALLRVLASENEQ